MIELSAYLARIGFAGDARPDVATLRAVHRGHALAIAYENLDVQLGRPLTTDPGEAFDKIVRRGRGGWCYEMNGLMGAALEAIGFKVVRLAGGVHRAVMGEVMVGNHLVLLVEAEGEPWIADVGFGDGPRDPFPLKEGPIVSEGFEYRLERADGDWWRLVNHPLGGAPSFDFRLDPADAALLTAKCHELQTSPASPFVTTLVCQRHAPGEIRMLRGRVFRRIRPGAKDESLIDSAGELVALLRAEFGLDAPEAAEIWPRIVARHEAQFAAAASA